MMETRKNFYLIFIICFLAASWSFCCLLSEEGAAEAVPDLQQDKDQQEQSPVQHQPRMHLESAKYDAGEVREGEKIIHSFTVKNTGTAELTISKVKTG